MGSDPPPPGRLLRLAPVAFVCLWSGGYPAAKLGLRHVEPFTFLALRFGAALLLLLVLYAILRPALPRSAREWGHLAVMGLLIQALYFGLSYVAFDSGVSAGLVALIVSMQPILVGVLAPLFVDERVSLSRWLGLLLGMAGAGLVIAARSAIAAESVAGLLAAAAALAAMSAAAIYEKRFRVGAHPVVGNAVQYLVGLAAVLPLAYAVESMHVDWTPDFAATLAYLVIGNSLIAITLLLAMLRRGEASRVSALLFLVPPGAAILSWLILGEIMPPLAWAGMALAAVGVLLATRPAKVTTPA